MPLIYPVKCLIRFIRAIERFTKSIPFSDFPVIEDLLKSLRVLPALFYMTIAPQAFYSKISRYAEGKSFIVPAPATFATSFGVLFLIGLFKSENEARVLLALAIVTAPIWVSAVVVVAYLIVFLDRPLLHYIYIFQPYWRGPELSVMFSTSAIARTDGKLFMKAVMFLATQCFLAIPIAFAPSVGITILWMRMRPDLYGNDMPEVFGRAFALTLYLSAILLTWLVARPAAYLFVYCLRIPTAQALRLTIFRKLLASIDESDNCRFVSDVFKEKVRSEWDEIVVTLRKQERKVRGVSTEALSEYLATRQEVFLDPLYRCFDDEKDKNRIDSLRTVATGRSLLANGVS